MNDVDRLRRVRALVRAARKLADPTRAGADDFRAKVRSATGLSAQGVDLALRYHLETNPTEEEILLLLGRVGRAQRVHVVLSANVFTAGLRALALAAATAPSVRVRCSSRENVFVPELLSLIDDSELRHAMSESLSIAAASGDEVHLYGSDESIVEICNQLGPQVLVRAHGTGFGLALIGSGSEPREAARALARDIVPFDQRGCLSPRIALVQGQDRARALAQSLANALQQADEIVPAGELTPQDRAEVVRFRETAIVAGEWLPAGPGGVAFITQPRGVWAAPSGRNLVVFGIDQCEPMHARIAELAPRITALGVSGDDTGFFQSIAACCAGARRSTVGSMQCPALDGPVDLRHPGVESPQAVIDRVRCGG